MHITDRRTDRRTDRQTDGRTDRQTEKNRQTDKGRPTDRPTDSTKVRRTPGASRRNQQKPLSTTPRVTPTLPLPDPPTPPPTPLCLHPYPPTPPPPSRRAGRAGTRLLSLTDSAFEIEPFPYRQEISELAKSTIARTAYPAQSKKFDLSCRGSATCSMDFRSPTRRSSTADLAGTLTRDCRPWQETIAVRNACPRRQRPCWKCNNRSALLHLGTTTGGPERSS